VLKGTHGRDSLSKDVRCGRPRASLRPAARARSRPARTMSAGAVHAHAGDGRLPRAVRADGRRAAIPELENMSSTSIEAGRGLGLPFFDLFRASCSTRSPLRGLGRAGATGTTPIMEVCNPSPHWIPPSDARRMDRWTNLQLASNEGCLHTAPLG